MLMKGQDYPSLFQGADAASFSAQRMYLLLQRMYIGSLIIAGMASMFTPVVSGGVLTCMYTAMAIILTAGLLVLWIGRSRRDDHVWFDCRAVAESVKTATWRFMMSAPPFESDHNLDRRFVSELQEIRAARPGCENNVAGAPAATSPAISDSMRQMRSNNFGTRKAFYLDQRVRNQKAWYSQKADMNARSGSRWFWMTAGLQVAAAAIAIIQAVLGGMGINLLPVITTCAAAVVAWNQVRRHEELKKTYALAAQELGELEAMASSLNAEDDFPQLVEQVEEAVSREHTMWCARRDVLLRRSGSGSR